MLRACRARCRTFSGARRATSEARALLLPQAAGLIALSDPGSTTATLKDVADNPLELEFREVEAVCAPGVRADVDIAVINTNCALEAKVPEGDAPYAEATDSPNVNVLVVKAGSENAPGIQAPVKAITSRKVADCINTTFCGTVVATKYSSMFKYTLCTNRF